MPHRANQVLPVHDQVILLRSWCMQQLYAILAMHTEPMACLKTALNRGMIESPDMTVFHGGCRANGQCVGPLHCATVLLMALV